MVDLTPTDLWDPVTCDTCLSPDGQGTRLYLPGPDSVCPCDTLMCIVVDLTAGGADYYYAEAETNGRAFTKTLVSACP